MIRRDRPLGGEPGHWLLIPQREHARLSYELAAAWGNDATPPLICPPDSNDAALSSMRSELLKAIRLHDEGWAKWEASPGIDPAHERPYGFTEMPPADAQKLWSESIEACRQIGPLAGWVVAGHFMQLQSHQDHDYPQWESWLAEWDQSRERWLAEWRASNPAHTRELAERALFYLRTFDWLSLWLCCRAPLVAADPTEEMRLHDEVHRFGPHDLQAGADAVTIDPWPFHGQALELSARALRVSAQEYTDTKALLSAADNTSIHWRLEPYSR